MQNKSATTQYLNCSVALFHWLYEMKIELLHIKISIVLVFTKLIFDYMLVSIARLQNGTREVWLVR